MKPKKQSLLAAARTFPKLRALVIGDIMLDTYEFLLTSESKPIDSEKPGKRAYKAQQAIRTLGGAGNVATNLAALGVHTSLIGLAGDDENYFVLRALADKWGIRHSLIRDSRRPTTTKVRVYLDGAYLLRKDDECSKRADRETCNTLLNEALREIPKADVVLLSDYNKGVFQEPFAQQIIRESQLHSIPVVVDFKPPNRAFFRHADVLCPNQPEAAEIVGRFSLAHLERDCRRLHDVLECRHVVVTLGKNGLCGLEDSRFFRIPGIKVRATDTVGCGDTVRVGLALGITARLPLEQAAELANAAAAIIAQKPATASLSLNELMTFIKNG